MKTLTLDHPAVRRAYIQYQDKRIALIVIETDALWPEFEATGPGTHPFISFGGDSCIFEDFDSSWYVFGCASCREGFAVTLFMWDATNA